MAITTKNSVSLHKKALLLTACAVCSFAFAGTLVGCSGNGHQIISTSQDCLTCHSSGKETYEVASPSSAKTTEGKVIVKTSAESLVVCTVIFTSSDGSSYVPENYKTVSVSNGQAEIELAAGIWAICIDEGGSSKSVLISSNGNASGEALSVEL